MKKEIQFTLEDIADALEEINGTLESIDRKLYEKA